MGFIMNVTTIIEIIMPAIRAASVISTTLTVADDTTFVIISCDTFKCTSPSTLSPMDIGTAMSKYLFEFSEYSCTSTSSPGVIALIPCGRT